MHCYAEYIFPIYEVDFKLTEFANEVYLRMKKMRLFEESIVLSLKNHANIRRKSKRLDGEEFSPTMNGVSSIQLKQIIKWRNNA